MVETQCPLRKVYFITGISFALERTIPGNCILRVTCPKGKYSQTLHSTYLKLDTKFVIRSMDETKAWGIINMATAGHERVNKSVSVI